MTSLRAGLLGVGMMGRNHARVLRELDGVELVGVADRRAILSARPGFWRFCPRWRI
jgi:predicted dehydrogenase